MARLLSDSHEAQRRADAMEADRIAARLRAQSDRHRRDETLIRLCLDGWSTRGSIDCVRTRSREDPRGTNVVAAFEEAQSYIELGLNPRECRDRKSGRKRKGAKKAAWTPWYQRPGSFNGNGHSGNGSSP